MLCVSQYHTTPHVAQDAEALLKVMQEADAKERAKRALEAREASEADEAEEGEEEAEEEDDDSVHEVST